MGYTVLSYIVDELKWMTPSKVLKTLPQRVQWFNRIGGFMPGDAFIPICIEKCGDNGLYLQCIYKYSSFVPSYDSL